MFTVHSMVSVVHWFVVWTIIVKMLLLWLYQDTNKTFTKSHLAKIDNRGSVSLATAVVLGWSVSLSTSVWTSPAAAVAAINCDRVIVDFS